MRQVSAAGAGDLLRRTVVTDASCLALIAILSALPYVSHLGFYSDDWTILYSLSIYRHGNFLGFINQGFPGRPIQGFYLAGLFELFGFNPLGYHWADTLVLAGCAALFYLLLLRLGFSRALSFATVLLFLMLPQLSTVRVWYAAFQIPLSTMLMFASLHWQLSFARSGYFGSLVAAIVSAVLSVGAYEIFAPLIAGFTAALIYVRWRSSKGHDWRLIGWSAFVLVLVVAGFAYKLIVSGRAGPVADPNRYLQGLRQLFRLDYDWRTDSGLNIFATPRTHFWAPVEGWWSGANALVRGQADFEVAAIAVAIGILALWRLDSREAMRADGRSPKLLLLGLAAFLLGNATFLVVPAVVFTSTGIGNRVQVASAIGVAAIFAALIWRGANLFPVPARRLSFAVAVGAITAAAFVRISGIERYWEEAPALQQRVLSAARADLTNLPADSTVILDGVCPYHGPAIVFETNWDLGSALTLALNRRIFADTVSPRMSVTRRGLLTSIYKQPSFYSFSPRLFAYDPVQHQFARLANYESAAAYFRDRKQPACPGYVARGVEV